jgi:RHS repeat-associated protein
VLMEFRPSGLGTVTQWGGRQTAYVWGGPGVGLLYEEAQDFNPLVSPGPGPEVRYYHGDQVGSTLALTDDTGAVTGRVEYHAYGHIVKREGYTNTPYLFCGAYGCQTDAESGLVLMRARYYHPWLGRFINEDPIQFEGGMNWYGYAGGDPVMGMDPSGLTTTRIAFINNHGVLELTTLVDPTTTKFRDAVSSLPNNSVVAMEMVGHGDFESIQIERNGNGIQNVGAAWGGVVFQGRSDSFSAVLAPKITHGCAIFLAGCKTASGTNNIARQLSSELPHAVVGGFVGKPSGNEFSNPFTGETLYRYGSESVADYQSSRLQSYFNGHPTRTRTGYSSYYEAVFSQLTSNYAEVRDTPSYSHRGSPAVQTGWRK